MRDLILCLAMLSCASFALTWDAESVTEGGSCSITIDTACLPRMAFAKAGHLGYASRNDTSWDLVYPDTDFSSGVSRIELCLDSSGAPHIGYVVVGWPEPSRLCHAFYDGINWHIDTLIAGAAPGSLTLFAMALDRVGTPRVLFLDSSVLRYGYKVRDTWHFVTVPASQSDTLRMLNGASLALDTNDRPGVAVTWWKHGSSDSLWLSFFEYDGQDWHRHDVDSTEGWAPWDFWPVRVRYDPASDLFHVVYRAWRYATGKGENWQAGWAGGMAGNVWCDFVLYQGWPCIICASPADPLTFQWRRAGGWEYETVRDGDVRENMSIAVDRTGGVHIVFQPFGSDTLYYASRAAVGAEEPAKGAQPQRQLMIRPNPVSRPFTVEFTAPRTICAAISITDVSGRTVWSYRENVIPGKHRTSASLPTSVSPGVYFCTLNLGAECVTRKVVLTD